jgi:uncharacterized cupin superfamily protein
MTSPSEAQETSGWIEPAFAIQRATEIELEPMTATNEAVDEGELDMRQHVLWTTPDNTTANGVWSCPPVRLTLVHPWHETFVVLAGRLTVTPEGGEPQEMGPGDLIVIPEGQVNAWEIHEQVTKVFVVHRADGLPDTSGAT